MLFVLDKDRACAEFPCHPLPGSDPRPASAAWFVVEFVAVAKALKVDPVDLFTRFVRAS